MNGPAQTVSVTLTLRLKVKREARAWLDAAAAEVNTVWNWANATSVKALRPFAGKPKWLSGFDLNNLSAGGTQYFEKIGADTIQRVNGEYAAKRRAVGIDLGLKAGGVTSEGARCEAGHFYRGIEQRIVQAQRRGNKHQAKRLHRKAANRRRDALHKFSRRIVYRYQKIFVGDVSSTR